MNQHSLLRGRSFKYSDFFFNLKNNFSFLSKESPVLLIASPHFVLMNQSLNNFDKAIFSIICFPKSFFFYLKSKCTFLHLSSLSKVTSHKMLNPTNKCSEFNVYVTEKKELIKSQRKILVKQFFVSSCTFLESTYIKLKCKHTSVSK